MIPHAGSTLRPSRRSISSCASSPTAAPRSCSTRPTIASSSAAATGRSSSTTGRSRGSSSARRSPSAPWSRAPSTSASPPRASSRMALHERLALRPGAKPRDPHLGRLLRRDVRDLCEQPSRRVQRERGRDGRQQGRAAGAGGDGADLRRHHRRHRSFGWLGVRAHKLSRLGDRRRLGLAGGLSAFWESWRPAPPAARSTG